MSDYFFDRNIICPQDPTASEERIAQYEKYYKVKYDICKAQNPKRIAEIGVRAGYSAWTFLQAAPQAKYFGFDANNGTHGGQGGVSGIFFNWTKKILSDAKFDFELFQIDTQKEASLMGYVSDIDLFHVDGDHTVEGVQHDLSMAAECISDSGLILVDDIDYIKDVKRGVDEWLKTYSEQFEYEYVPSLRGEYLIRLK